MRKEVGEPMEVTRVTSEDNRGTDIEPPLDQEWSEFDKLRWQMGVVKVDSGLDTRIFEMSDGRFSINILGVGWSHSLSSRGYHHAWETLTYLSMGARFAQDRP